ncbi:MAG TPA: hypothetical protein VI094_08990 [Propionibacteriaceae bacterium]
MLYGTYPFDEAGGREIAAQQLRRASNTLSPPFGAASDIDNGLNSVEGACGKNSTGALDGPGGIAWSKSA